VQVFALLDINAISNNADRRLAKLQLSLYTYLRFRGKQQTAVAVVGQLGVAKI
jgi:hypothetical protein